MWITYDFSQWENRIILYYHNISNTDKIPFTDQHQHDILNIMDDRGNIFLECNRVKNTCMRNVLNINSPSGFKLGSVRNRLVHIYKSKEFDSTT